MRVTTLAAAVVTLAVGQWVAHDSRAQTVVTLFGAASPRNPVDADANSVTLGVKFYATQAGTISGVRFYRGRMAGSNYVARLYTATGTMLGSVTVSRLLGTGWLTGTFASPIPIAANTSYIAAYFSPGGHYAGDNLGLQNGVSSGPLIAPASGTSGGNGVYCYGGSVCFPTQTYQASNYWVDVNFTAQQAFLQMSFNPAKPSISANTPKGSAVAAVNVTWSDGSPFTGTLAFAPPYSNDNGTFDLSGSNVIISPSGPGVGADGGTTQNITVQATQ